MDKILWIRFLVSQSDNLKSKACPFDKLRAGSEQRRRIQNLKLAGFLAVFLVVGVGLAQAQQPKKVPRIGKADRGDDSAVRTVPSGQSHQMNFGFSIADFRLGEENR
jgi:hypothetical protein